MTSKPAASHDREPMDEALDWLSLNQGGRPGRKERAEFLRWLNRHPDNSAAYSLAQSLWQGAEIGLAAQAVAGDRDAGGKAGRRDTWAGRMRGIAAAILLVVCLAAKINWHADFATGVGERRHLTFVDGSEITLNTDSGITASIDSEGRQVELLAGEAFFQVASDKSRPFTVVSDDTVVTVVGTEFSVRREEDRVRVSVREGLVDVRRGDAPAVRLRAGDRAVADAGLLEVSRGDALPGDFSWVDNRLVFHDQPLSAVVDEIARYHRGAILIPGGDMGAARVSGNFSLDDPAGALEALARINGFELVRLSDYLLILRRGD